MIIAGKGFFCFEAGRFLRAPPIPMGFITRLILGSRPASHQHPSPIALTVKLFFPALGRPRWRRRHGQHGVFRVAKGLSSRAGTGTWKLGAEPCVRHRH